MKAPVIPHLTRSVSVDICLFQVGPELRSRREQLLRDRDCLEEANNELSRVGRLITIIQIRIISNKILLIFLIIIECAVLVALCYIKFIRH